MSPTNKTPGRIRPAPAAPLSAESSARRGFVRRTVALGGGVAAGSALGLARADDAGRNLPPNVPQSNRALGAPILASPYGVPAKYEANIRRRESPGLTRTAHSSVAFTLLQDAGPRHRRAHARALDPGRRPLTLRDNAHGAVLPCAY